MNNSRHIILVTTTNDKNIAKLIATKLIEQNIAACSQIDKIDSFYKDDGQVISSVEFRIMVKTVENKYMLAQEEIKKYHNYHLPQIITLPIIGGSADYLKWMEDQTGSK